MGQPHTSVIIKICGSCPLYTICSQCTCIISICTQNMASTLGQQQQCSLSWHRVLHDSNFETLKKLNLPPLHQTELFLSGEFVHPLHSVLFNHHWYVGLSICIYQLLSCYTYTYQLTAKLQSIGCLGISSYKKQVDILISKSQALQILYLKHCVYKTT